MDDAALTFVAKLDDQASAQAEHLEKQMRALGGPVDPITADIDVKATGLDRAARAAEQTGDGVVDDMGKSGREGGRELGEGLRKGFEGARAGLEKAAAVTGAAIGVGVAGAIAEAMNVEDARAKLTAQLGATGQDAERYGNVAGSLYRDAWGDSLEEVSDAVAATASSIDGMGTGSAAALEGATRKAIAFADVFDTDVARSTQVVGQAIRTGLVKDATQGFDLLTKASQSVPANVREDLLDAVDEYSPFFKSLGLSGEQAFGLLAKGADKGMYGIDKTGDALKEFTIRATDMSSTTQAALGAIQGIDVTTIDKNSKQGQATLKALGESAGDLANDLLAGGDTAAAAFDRTVQGLLKIEDPGERANAAIGLFGTPLEDLSTQEIPKFLKSLTLGESGLGEFKGAADELTDTVGGTTSNGFKTLRRDLEQTAAEWATKLLPTVQRFLPEIKAAAPILLAMAVAFTALSAAVKVFQTVQTAIGIIRALTMGTQAATGAQVGLNVALTANPIGLIIAGIAALVAGLVLFFTKTEIGRKVITKVWGGIKTAVAGFVSWWSGTAWPAIRKVLVAIGTAFLTLVSWVRQRWDTIRNVIKGAVTLVATIIRTYVNLWVAIIRGAINAVRAIIGWFGQLGSLVRGWFAKGVAAIRTAAGNAAKAARAFVDKVVSPITGLIGRVVGFGRDVVEGFARGIRQNVQKVIDAGRRLVDNITGPVKKLLGIHSPSRVFKGFGVDTVRGYVKGLDESRDKARDAVGRLVKGIRDAKGLSNPRESALVKYVQAQGRALDKAWKGYDKALARETAAREKLASMRADRAQMRDSVASSVMGELDLGSVIAKDADGNTLKGKTTFKAVASYVSGLVGKWRLFAGKLRELGAAGLPAGLVQQVAGLGVDDGTEVAKALLSGTRSQIKSLKADWSALETYSKAAGNAVAAVTYDAGIAAQEGLVRGLTADTRKAQKAAQTLARNLAKWVRAELGIHSPSKVFEGIGDDTVAGLAGGLRNVDPVASAAGNLVGAMMQPLDAVAVNPVTVAGNATVVTRVQVEHIITSPDGSVRNYTAQQLADILARDPAATRVLEAAVRKAQQAQQARTLSATA